jgi:hypothetical protein
MRGFKPFSLVIMLWLIVGCTNAAPTPDADAAILTGFDTLPKALATIALSPTPDAPQVRATIDSRRPTETLPPPTFTATPTPYVGIFMGDSTFSAGSILPTGTRGPRVVTVAPQTPTRGAPAQGGNPTAVAVAGGGTARNCPVQAAQQFVKASGNAAVAQRLGCPRAAPYTVNLVAQPFQTGYMFWRDTKEIYVLSTGGIQKGASTDTFWRFPDNWDESLPASDPSQVAPAGLIQPIRGFGYVWRSNATVKNSVGWALAPEQPFTSMWQDFERGWLMTTNDGAVIAFAPLDGPPVTTGQHFGTMPQ